MANHWEAAFQILADSILKVLNKYVCCVRCQTDVCVRVRVCVLCVCL